jgi:hypothetical protein
MPGRQPETHEGVGLEVELDEHRWLVADATPRVSR